LKTTHSVIFAHRAPPATATRKQRRRFLLLTTALSHDTTHHNTPVSSVSRLIPSTPDICALSERLPYKVPLEPSPKLSSVGQHYSALQGLNLANRQTDTNRSLACLTPTPGTQPCLRLREPHLLHSNPAYNKPHPQPSVAPTHRFTPYGGVWSCAITPSLFNSFQTHPAQHGCQPGPRRHSFAWYVCPPYATPRGANRR
jgi:hypothetical protein